MTAPTPMKVCLVTLGCPKNVVEGESMAGIITAGGFELTTDIHAADAAVVHTCSFISDARKESTAAVASLSALKKKGKLGKLIVTGCLVQERGKILEAEFPDVDGFIGTGQLDRIAELLSGSAPCLYGKPGGLLESPHPRLLSSALPSAYLRLAEGCSHRCGFCMIPFLRGPHRSRKLDSILEEAQDLADVGIKELILVSQDTTYYGRDRYGHSALPHLLKKLSAIRGLRWIRLLYAHPGSLTAELVSVMKSRENICRYLDMPLQHVSDGVLRSMGRGAGARRTVIRLKESFPDLALRTTFIVGYPGETERQFDELRAFVAEGWFDNLGVFEYSPHPALRSARLPDAVPGAEKRRRRKELMLLQKSIVLKKNRRLTGSTVDVLVETPVRTSTGKTLWSGRSQFQSPDIDGKIFFSGKASAGSFVPVRITGHTSYDLLGEIVRKTTL